jgi:hypothetical protein
MIRENYMPEKVELDLYRSIRIEEFPLGIFKDSEPVPGLLYPTFHPKPLPNGRTRVADVVTETVDGVEWVRSGGGTSLFDRANVFEAEGWASFEIPEGTAMPDSLVVKNTGYNKRFKATHYQIESRAQLMTKTAMQGALDNLARCAIVRSIELGRKI